MNMNNLNHIKSFDEFIFEGNITHKVAKWAQSVQKDWSKELKDVKKKYENALKNQDLMKEDFEKYLDEQFKAMDEFNNKVNELVDKPEVFVSSIIYQISFIKTFQTNLFKFGLGYIKHAINNYKTSKYKQSMDYIHELCEDTIKNVKNTVDGINQVLDYYDNNKDLFKGLELSYEDLKTYIEKYKLPGLKFTNRFEIEDENAIIKKFDIKVKELIEKEKEKS